MLDDVLTGYVASTRICWRMYDTWSADYSVGTTVGSSAVWWAEKKDGRLVGDLAELKVRNSDDRLAVAKVDY